MTDPRQDQVNAAYRDGFMNGQEAFKDSLEAALRMNLIDAQHIEALKKENATLRQQLQEHNHGSAI